MTEEEARDWIVGEYGAAACERMTALVALVTAENARQNLVAPSTIAAMWSRHLVDSAQLVRLVADRAGRGAWLDIGSGAGFPGLVVALLSERPVILVEPRRKRAAFLADAAKALGVIERTEILCSSVERIARPAAVISARAVAPIASLLALASQCATPATVWILPKGRSARGELATAVEAWHGTFHVEHSITDPQSLIVLASGVSRR